MHFTAQQILVAETEQGRSVVGIVDGFKGKGVEGKQDKAKRKKLVRDLGYKVQ